MFLIGKLDKAIEGFKQIVMRLDRDMVEMTRIVDGALHVMDVIAKKGKSHIAI